MRRKSAVGYGHPPAHTRFRPGHSGNPWGRPKGARNLGTDLSEELGERVTVREGEQAKRMSKQRALLKSLMARALKGDARAASTLLNMVFRVLDAAPAPEPEAPLTAEEREILEVFERRIHLPTGPRSPSQSLPRKRLSGPGNGR